MFKPTLAFFLRYLIFWLGLFNLVRLLFILVYFKQTGESYFDLLSVPLHALRLDFSMYCYLAAFPLIGKVVQPYTQQIVIPRLIKYYTVAVAMIYLMIAAAEINLYAEWQTKIDYRAVIYLKKPSEVFSTATWLQTTIFFIYLLIGLYLIVRFFRYYLANYQSLKTPNHKGKAILFTSCLLFFGFSVLVIGLRGGLQQIPINQSSAYFSKNNTVNLVSVNAMWNLLASMYQNSGNLEKNPYAVLPQTQVESIIASYQLPKKDTTVLMLNTNKPNIVLLILESYSADLIGACGGDTGISPNLEKLIKEGYLFDQIYASGTLSHQGMASIFSGFPAQPNTSIIKEQAKFSKLPCLNKQLKQQGYFTSFYFGGELSYANIKSYLYFNRFDIIKDIEDYGQVFPSGKLGIHDEYMFREHIQEISKLPEPFLSAIFTVSTHSPYDIPATWKISKGGSEQDFLNAANYSDSCLGAYINACKKTNWYKNTLFVVVADHSKHTHFDRNYFDPLSRHIPLFFFGDVLKPEFRGKVNHVFASQHDFATTLLKQLGLKADDFKWGRNLMNPYTQEYAFLAMPNGFGMAMPGKSICYNYLSGNFDYQSGVEGAQADSLKIFGQAYLQKLMQTYMAY